MPAQFAPVGVPAKNSCAGPPRPPKAGAPCPTSTQLPAETSTMACIVGTAGNARTSWIWAGVSPRMVLGSTMNGRLATLGGKKTRTY